MFVFLLQFLALVLKILLYVTLFGLLDAVVLANPVDINPFSPELRLLAVSEIDDDNMDVGIRPAAAVALLMLLRLLLPITGVAIVSLLPRLLTLTDFSLNNQYVSMKPLPFISTLPRFAISNVPNESSTFFVLSLMCILSASPFDSIRDAEINMNNSIQWWVGK